MPLSPHAAPPHPHTARRQLVAWCLLTGSGALLTGLAGCDRKPQPPEKLRLAHAYQAAFGLLYVAEGAGLFKEEGLEVEFQRYSSGRDALTAVLDGKAEVGTPFDAPVVVDILKQKPLRVLCTMSQLTANTVVLGRKDRGIRSAADLKGHRVAFVADSGGEYVLSLLLASAGIAVDKLQLIPMKVPEAAQALLKGEVDAATLWAPLSVQVKKELGPDALVTLAAPGYLEVATLTTLDSVLQQRRSAIDKLLRALVKAETLAQREPERALQLIQAALPELAPDVVAQGWKSLQAQIRLNNQLHTSLSNQVRWFGERQTSEHGLQATDVRLHLADAPLRAIHPQAVTLPPAH